jgi:hypothetical protein
MTSFPNGNGQVVHSKQKMGEFINWFLSISLSVMFVEFAVITKRAVID